MSNESIVKKFFTSYQLHDYLGMHNCLDQNVKFSDFAFDISGDEVKAMWRWFCMRYPPRELPIEVRAFEIIKSEGESIHVDYRVIYLYGDDQRPVDYWISAHFVIKNDKIVEQKDSFKVISTFEFASMAFGLPKSLLAFTSFFQKQLKKAAAKKLNQFMTEVVLKDPQAAITDAVLANSLKEQEHKGPNLRQVHSKSHGLVSGKFIVEEYLSDERCKVGVFATPKEYDIWVRFSNGSSPKALGIFKPDTEGDARGMAIKLKNVDGNKVASDEEDTQDFTLINHHVFFLPDVAGYIDFGEFRKAMEGGEKLDPVLAQKLAPTLAILKEMSSKVIGNPLSIQYWSTTPYKLGSNFIKFSVKPHDLETVTITNPDPDSRSQNYLREAIVSLLTNERKEIVFDFLVQFFVDESKTPIENPMKEWTQEDSPFIKIATITIPAQEFDNDERKQLDASLSFTPWHTLPEHQPVGSVNLARRKIYQEIAKARREA